MKLSLDQLKGLAAQAGFTGDDINIAAAVAMAESGGDPNAYNTEGSYGLWQVYLPAHPQYANDPNALYTPSFNAQAAYSIWRAAGNSFNPWSTYKYPCTGPNTSGPACYLQFYTPSAPSSSKLTMGEKAAVAVGIVAAGTLAFLAFEEWKRPGSVLAWR